MASRFWVGGTGTWDTSTTTHWSTIDGGSGGASVPTITDDVFLTAGSGGGTITVATGAICANFNATGFAGTLFINASLTTTPTAGGVVTLGLGMLCTGGATLNVNGSGSGTSTFTTNSVVIPRVNFISATTATILLADALTVSLNVILTQGKLDTAGVALNWGTFSSSGASTRTLALGASALTLTGNGSNVVWDTTTNTNLAVSTNTCIVSMNSASHVFRVGSTNFNGLSLIFDAVNSGSSAFGIDNVSGTTPTFKNITVLGNTGVGTAWLCIPNITVTGTLTLTPDADTHRILVCRANSGPTNGTTTITAANVVCSHVVDFMEITGAGAATWTTAATGALYFGDCGGNSGITFTTPAAQTWQGTSGGNWSDVSKWTSRVPLPQDDVSFNGVAFTGGQTITQTMPRMGASIDFTGVSGTPTLNGGGWFFGSLTLVSGMALSTGSFAWTALGRSVFTITTAGKTITNSFTVDAIGGTYTVVGSFTSSFGFGFTHGALTLGGNVTAATFSSSSSLARTLTFNPNSTVTVTGSGNVWNMGGSGLSFVNALTTTILLTDTTASAKTFQGLGLSYGIVRSVAGGTGGLTITGNNTFVALDVETTAARTLTLPASGTQTITGAGSMLSLTGATGQVLSIVSSTPGTATTIALTGPFYTTNQFVSPSGDVTLPAAKFWVGGTGNFGDTAHWSTASGGAGGAAVPTVADIACINSDSGAGTVTVDLSTYAVKSLNCTGYTGTFDLNAKNFTVGGSTTTLPGLVFVAGMTFAQTGGGNLIFSVQNAGTGTVTTGGQPMSSCSFSGATTGSWTLQDAFSTAGQFNTITHSTGVLNTNSQTCSWGIYSGSFTNTRTLTLGSSAITMTGAASATWTTNTSTNLTITANTATITFTGASSATLFQGGSADYNGASLVFTGSGSPIISFAGTVQNITRTGTAIKTDSVQFFTTGTITIAGTLTLNGNSITNRLAVISNTIGTPVALTAAAVSITNADFQDITGAGAANWNLSAIPGGSGDMGGNTGITFTPAAAQAWQTTVSGSWSTAGNWTSRVPLPQDDVTINKAFSGGQTITADMPRLGASVDFTGTTGTPTLSLSLGVQSHGNLTLIAGLGFSGSQTWTFAGRGSYTITSAGRTFPGNITIAAPGGTYGLADALTMSTGGPNLAVTNGTFNTNSQTISLSSFSSSGSLVRAVNLGSSTINLTKANSGSSTTWNLGTTTNLTFDAGTSTIQYIGVPSLAAQQTFVGGNQRYWIVRCETAGPNLNSITIQGNNQFQTLDFGGSTRTITLPAGGTQVVSGGCLTLRNLTAVVSSAPGTGTTIVVADGSFFNLDSYNPSGDVTIVTPTMSIPSGQSLGRAHL